MRSALLLMLSGSLIFFPQQTDIWQHWGAFLVFSESAFAEFSFSTPSAPPPTYTFKLIRS